MPVYVTELHFEIYCESPNSSLRDSIDLPLDSTNELNPDIGYWINVLNSKQRRSL